MNKRQKLELINNYVEIYKCIYDCKHAILNCADQNNLKVLSEFCNELLELKKTYEQTFISNNIMDESLILLKTQLDTALKNIQSKATKAFSIDTLISKKQHFEFSLKKYIG